MNHISEIKNRLLPLTPVVGVLERLLECLPRQRIQVRLKASSQISVLDINKGEYRANGNAPEFEIDFDPSCFEKSWCYLEVALTRNSGNREASLRVISQNGKKTIILIPSNLRGTVREVIHIPDDVVSLFWSPMKAPGFFSQSEFQLHRITLLESMLRRLYRVLHDCYRYRHNFTVMFPGFSMIRLLTDLHATYTHTARMRINRTNNNDYSAFISKYDSLNVHEVSRIMKLIANFETQPLISIIMSVRDDDISSLNSSLESVKQQLYSNWELIISCASLGVRNQTTDVVHADTSDRIRIVSPDNNAEIMLMSDSDLLNQSLQTARGEWVMHLIVGDRLPRHALFHLVDEINKHPVARFIYGDDDYVNATCQRREPRFKPNWNPDLLTSCDYIGPPALYYYPMLVKIGGYALGVNGVEDYELRLRYLKDLGENHIRHVHKVLYHQLIRNISTDEEQQLHAAGWEALRRHFLDTGVKVENGVAPLLYHIRHPIPSPAPLVSIIIPNKNKAELLRTCIGGIINDNDYPNWEIIIVDNNSTEQTMLAYLESLLEDSRIRVLHYNEPFNYSAMNNLAVRHALGEILLLLNNDIEVISPGWLTEMVSHAIRPGTGAVGAKLLYPDNTVQHVGVILGIGGVAAHMHRFLSGDAPGYCFRAVVAQNISAVTGACLAVRKSLYNQVGGLDEVNLHVAYNDIDFCLKLLDAGYKNIFTPFASLYHHESLTRGTDDTLEKKAIYHREFNYMKNKWGDKLVSDPAYNKNLSLENEHFAFNM